MSGLDSILEKIHNDSKAQCDFIIEQARRKADAMLEQAKTTAKQDGDAIIERANEQAQSMVKRAHSTARTNRSRAILAQKVDIIDEVQKLAIEHIQSLPDAEYTNVFKKLALHFSVKGEGILSLSRNDAARLPTSFETDLNSALAQKGASLRLQVGNIKPGGFVLIYGDVEYNCMFESLLETKRDLIKDSLNLKLFD